MEDQDHTDNSDKSGKSDDSVDSDSDSDGVGDSESASEVDDRQRLGAGAKSAIASLCVALLLAGINQVIVLSYFVLSPGSADPVQRFITIPQDKLFVPQGQILFTTVGIRQAHPFDIVWAWITPNSTILKKKELIGDSTPKQYFEENEQSMIESQLTAESLALTRAGYNAQIVGDGSSVMAISPSSPAAAVLRAGDVITAVDGKTIVRADDLLSTLHAIPPGTAIRADVTNSSGVKRVIEVTTAPRPDNPAVSYLGVSVQTKNPRLDSPFPVELKTEEIGGPSAGLAFTLTALDDLTPGNLTGGKNVATTGTIASDGHVGEVGGVEQKTAAVVKSGAKLFIVPRSEVPEAEKHARNGLKVVGVDNLDQAIAALRDNGGDVSGVAIQKP